MQEEQETDDGGATMGQAVTKGIIIGTPVAIVALTLIVWLITDNDLGDSFATAIMPGVMLGAFAGGFVGMAATMD